LAIAFEIGATCLPASASVSSSQARELRGMMLSYSG
jgi:hypothetical protein